MLLGLTLALYTHAAFFVYAGIFLTLDAVYFRDRHGVRPRWSSPAPSRASRRCRCTGNRCAIPDYVSFNNTVYDPGGAVRLAAVRAHVLLQRRDPGAAAPLVQRLPQPRERLAAGARGRRRSPCGLDRATGFYAWAAVLTQVLLRLNTPEAGAHLRSHPAHVPAARRAGARGIRAAASAARAAWRSRWSAAIALFVADVVRARPPRARPARLRSAPDRSRSPRPTATWSSSRSARIATWTATRVPQPRRRRSTSTSRVCCRGVAGQRFYSQMIDGWVWNIFRGQVVGAGTFAGRAID